MWRNVNLILTAHWCFFYLFIYLIGHYMGNCAILHFLLFVFYLQTKKNGISCFCISVHTISLAFFLPIQLFIIMYILASARPPHATKQYTTSALLFRQNTKSLGGWLSILMNKWNTAPQVLRVVFFYWNNQRTHFWKNLDTLWIFKSYLLIVKDES